MNAEDLKGKLANEIDECGLDKSGVPMPSQ